MAEKILPATKKPQQINFFGVDVPEDGHETVQTATLVLSSGPVKIELIIHRLQQKLMFQLRLFGITFETIDVHLYAVTKKRKKNLQITVERFFLHIMNSKWTSLSRLQDFIHGNKLDIVGNIGKQLEESDEWFEVVQVERLDPFEEAFVHGKGNDAKFLIGGKTLEFAKVFLIASSKVFEAMFAKAWKDTEMEEIVIEDADYETMEEFVKSLYKRRYEAKSLTKAFHVYLVADKYDVDFVAHDALVYMEKNLKEARFEDVLQLFTDATGLDIAPIEKIVRPFLAEKIVDTNVLQVLQVADQLKCEPLRQVTLDYLSKFKRKGQIEKLPGFDQLDINLLIKATYD